MRSDVISEAVFPDYERPITPRSAGSFRNCKPLPDLPACDWHVYAGVGMLIGAVTLPYFALSRLRKGEKEADKSR